MAVRHSTSLSHGGPLAYTLRLTLALFLAGIALVTTGAEAPAKSKKEGGGSKNAADDLAYTNFFAGPILRIEIEIPKVDLPKMNGGGGPGSKHPDVTATVKVGNTTYDRVAIHLKGAAGSYRPINDPRPAFTLNFGKLNDGQKFNGMRKIHLNNSVQDPSQLSELYCGELYRRAGVPATRATHALVSLNGRDLGVYVLKEGFDKPFLRRNFGDSSGNLYDGGFVQDIDGQLERDSGEGPDNHADLRQLVNAAMESKLETRLKKLDQILDIDKFLTLSALQFLFDDWDGYVRNHNNYRIYHDPKSGKFVFLPHGMDQMFGTPTTGLTQTPNSLLGRQLFAIPAVRSNLMERIALMTNQVFTAATLDDVLSEPQKRLATALADRKRDLGQLTSAGSSFRSRVSIRLTRVTRGVPKPVLFDSNREFSLAKSVWTEHPTGNGANHFTMEFNGKPMLVIAAKEAESSGSYRTSVMLAPGLYRFEAMARAEDIKPMQTGRGTGAGIRISREPRANKLVGSSDWSKISHDFEVTNPGDVQMVLELYASGGQIVFDQSSLKLRRL